MDLRTGAAKARLLPGFAAGAARGHAGARIATGVKLRGPGRRTIGLKTSLGEDVRIYVGPGATLDIGARVTISDRTVINCADHIEIADEVGISWQCQILDTDFHPMLDEDGNAPPMNAPVRLGVGVMVGTGSIILKGVTIGERSVIGAGSVVTRDIPDHVLAAGNPAKPIRKISGWVRPA